MKKINLLKHRLSFGKVKQSTDRIKWCIKGHREGVDEGNAMSLEFQLASVSVSLKTNSPSESTK